VRWLADRGKVDLRKGGTYRLGWSGGATRIGTLALFAPDQRVNFAWTWPGVLDAGTTRLRLEVERSGDGMLLRLSHPDLPAGADRIEPYAGAVWGWTYAMMNLKADIEHRIDRRSNLDG
jgi:hypothetical protein